MRDGAALAGGGVVTTARASEGHVIAYPDSVDYRGRHYVTPTCSCGWRGTRGAGGYVASRTVGQENEARAHLAEARDEAVRSQLDSPAWWGLRCETPHWTGSPDEGCDDCGFTTEVQ